MKCIYIPLLHVPFASLPDFLAMFPSVHSYFSLDSPYDLTLLLWLYISLRVCDVLFSCSVLAVVCLYVETVLSARMALWDLSYNMTLQYNIDNGGTYF
jgi:hypothetical protein